MKKDLVSKILALGIIVLFVVINIVPTIRGQIWIIANVEENNYMDNKNFKVEQTEISRGSWYENFDDGDISDWFIENPYSPEGKSITMHVSMEQSVSSPYSLKVSGPKAEKYCGRGTGPNPQINSEISYTIEFQFRWADFHWYYLVAFQQVRLYIDTPELPIGYFDENGRHKLWKTPNFKEYCPVNTWTHFKIEANPNDFSYTIIVDGSTLAVINYGSYNSAIEGFRFQEPYDNIDYLVGGYYDDISIYQTPFTPSFIVGMHHKLTVQGKQISFEAVRIRVISFFPINHYMLKSREEIHIRIFYCGLLNERYIFALCWAIIKDEKFNFHL